MSEGRMTVLIVDDDRDVRRALKFSLELDGFDVHVCESGEELLQHPALKASGCIVVDYMMRGMDGLEVLDRLKEAGVRAPVIFISGAINTTLAQRAIRKGARSVLEKPIFQASLAERVHELTS